MSGALAIVEPPAERRRPGRPRKPLPPPPPRPRRKPGTGSVTILKNGRVYAQDVRDAEGHREQYEALGADVAARIADAEAWLAGKIEARRRLAGLAPEAVRDYLERWLWQAHRTSPVSTMVTYRSHLRRAAPIGDVPVTDLLVAASVDGKPPRLPVDRVTDAMLDAGLSPSYARDVRRTLKTAFAGLVPRVLDRNPVGKYDANLPRSQRRPKVWDAADADAFERASLTTTWGLLWVLGLRYGLRRGELQALRRPDLNPATRQLTIAHGMRSGRRLADTKNHRERTIKLTQRLCAALARFMASEHSSPTWIFAMAGGVPLTRDRFYAEFDRIVARVNERRYKTAIAAGASEDAARLTALPDLTPHGLRHTAATLMLRRRVPLAKVAQILGHANPETTMRLYGWAVPSDDDVVDAAIDGLMAPLGDFAGFSAAWQQSGSD